MDVEGIERIKTELVSGESLLWSGCPKQGFILRSIDIFLIPFSLFWTGFAIYWEYSVYIEGGLSFFLLFGAIFVVMGLYLVFGRFIVDALLRSRTYYGVTNDRVMILSEFPRSSLKSLNLRTLSDLTISKKLDGTGNISFGPQNIFGAWYDAMPWPGMGQHQSPRFEMISEVEMVYDIIRKAQSATESK